MNCVERLSILISEPFEGESVQDFSRFFVQVGFGLSELGVFLSARVWLKIKMHMAKIRMGTPNPRSRFCINWFCGWTKVKRQMLQFCEIEAELNRRTEEKMNGEFQCKSLSDQASESCIYCPPVPLFNPYLYPPNTSR
jgi:hypothetical protein